MKTRRDIYSVEKKGIGDTHRFKLLANEKLFDILSKKLYSNKVQAIVRELNCNAYDAHVEAEKKDEPWILKIPNRLDSTFYCEDFGTGIHPDEIEELYSTVGLSTKDDSNEYVGSFGIGRLSLLTLTQNFLLENWYDGIRYVYNVFLGEDGIPHLTKLGEDKSDRCNGLKVSCNLGSKYTYEFEKECRQVLKYFDTIPNIEGSSIKINREEYCVSDKDWGLKERSSRSFYGTSQSYAIMGNVSYPIDSSQFNSDIIRVGVDIWFNIGDLDVLPSREGLQYTKFTMDSINKKLIKIKSQIQAKIEQKIQDSKNLWEARCNLLDMQDNYPITIPNCTWNGQEIFDKKVIGVGKSIFIDTIDDLVVFRYYLHTYHIRPKKSSAIYIKPNKNVEFFKSDLNRGNYSRINYYTESNPQKNIYLIDEYNKTSLKIFCDRLGIDESYIKNVSSLPKKPKQVSTSVNRNIKYTKNINKLDRKSHAASSSWEGTQVDLRGGGIYVELKRYDVYNPLTKKWVKFPDYKRLLNFLEQMGEEINDEVYGVKSKIVSEVRKRGNWTNLYYLAEDKFKKVRQKYNLEKIEGDYTELQQVQQQNFLQFHKLESVLAICNGKPDLDKLRKELETVKENSKNQEILLGCKKLYVHLYGKHLQLKPKPSKNLVKSVDNFFNRYKLIKHVDSYVFVEPQYRDHIKSYVNSV